MPITLRRSFQDPTDLRAACPACRVVVGPLVGEFAVRAGRDVFQFVCPACNIVVNGRVDWTVWRDNGDDGDGD